MFHSMTNLDTSLHQAVLDYIRWHRISARRFGIAALGDPALMITLDNGRSVRLGTADRILAYIGAEPIGGCFRREVEAFLRITRVKPSILGFETTGSPSFVTKLRGGFSPRLTTVTSVRIWMTAQANAVEAEAIRHTAGDLPEIGFTPAAASRIPDHGGSTQ